jgi:hypothetical protein
MHIIQCGYSIKCHPEVSEELYSHLVTDNHAVESPFVGFPECVGRMFGVTENNVMTTLAVPFTTKYSNNFFKFYLLGGR